MILVCTDSDGVIKDDKKPIAPEIIYIITTARRQYGVNVVRITGAPCHHLRDGLVVDRAFGESGGIELLADGTVVVDDYGLVAQDALNTLKRMINLMTHDGLADSLHGTFGVEGPRYTTLTLFFGDHPLYPHYSTSGNADIVAKWIQEHIRHENLPLCLMRGNARTFEYIDIGHREVMKKERVISQIAASGNYERKYYLGDSGNDAGAMELEGFVPVTFSNGTEPIKEIVRRRNGILLDKPGPHGGSIEFFRRLIEGALNV